MKPVYHLFWDFDGTLYDSYPQIHSALINGLAMLGHQLDEAETLRQLKYSVTQACRWCADQTGEDAQRIYECYHSYQEKERNFPPYEGMADCLKTLREAGVHHYLYTHRDTLAIEQLGQDGLWTLFDDAVTSDDHFPGKPAPDALNALVERNGLDPQSCAMVGDRDIDIQAGHNAGMQGILFDPDGYFPNTPAELYVKSMTELCARVKEALQK